MRIDNLPAAALEAVRVFHDSKLDEARAMSEKCESLVIVLPPAEYDHADWRRAAARDLAREIAPKRVNIVSGDNDTRIAATCDYLGNAPGVTGQYLPLA